MIRIFFLLFLIPLFSENEEIEQYYPNYKVPQSDYLYLLTEPRSGTHWVQSSIQYLTERRVLPFEKKRIATFDPEAFGCNIFDISIDATKTPFFRTHCEKSMKGSFKKIPAFSKRNKLVFLTRNYKEIFPRRVRIRSNSDDWNSALRTSRFILYDYMRKIAFFDKWDPENSMLIYYEDLISNPEEIITKLAEFLDVPSQRLSSYLENQKELRKKSFDYYAAKVPTGTVTTGNETKFHSLTLEKEIIGRIDSIIHSLNPRLAEKYLSRYL
jgi:hypothetical protein